jgi:hypothetical protein|tara:strand:+ start:2160 stop:2426 length:267 start_codon:yes stop_codon:yes gene_type:complete
VNLFKKQKSVYQTYQPVLEAKEVIDLFSRLTLHHQAALLRLISRNLMVEADGEIYMGYEFDYDVDGAMILAHEHEPQGELELDQTGNP